MTLEAGVQSRTPSLASLIMLTVASTTFSTSKTMNGFAESAATIAGRAANNGRNTTIDVESDVEFEVVLLGYTGPFDVDNVLV